MIWNDEKFTKKKYIVVYQEETDGDFLVEEMTKKEIDQQFPGFLLDEVVVIEGKIIKGENEDWPEGY